MSDLIRLFYTSTADRRQAANTAEILTQSVSNNTVNGITGVLLAADGRYFQVIEGSRQNVYALLNRLRKDKRHHSIRIYFEQRIDNRMFDGWAMVSPSIDNQQIRSTLELLRSDDDASRDIGMTYLRYWLSTQASDPNGAQASVAVEAIRVDDFLAGHQRSRDFSIIAFCIAILVAVVIDVGFFIREYTQGIDSSLRMIHSHAFSALGLMLAIYIANRHDLSRGVATFQFTAVVSVGLHMLYAGYGINAPTLPYLGLAIVSGIISNRSDHNLRLLFACLGLIMTALLATLFSPSGEFSQPVPLHHHAAAGLLFPLVCALVLDAQRHRNGSNQRFTAQVLGDLTQNIDRLRNAMAARNYFFSAISHEIRTPMAGAQAAVTLLKHPNASDAVKVRSLDSLEQSMGNLNHLLNDLLDVSKLESGRFQLSAEPFDLIEATRNAVEFFQPGAFEHGNRLTLNTSVTRAWVIGDAVRYQQMISNLLSNAVKFTRNGSITATLSCVNADEQQVANTDGCTHWRCEVSDTGVGIPVNDLIHLFQPFSQASQHGYSKTKGTGLGLAIVASLARQMNGDVGVRSIEGQGSSFWFTFQMPLAPEALPDAASRNTQTASLAPSSLPARVQPAPVRTGRTGETA